MSSVEEGTSSLLQSPTPCEFILIHSILNSISRSTVYLFYLHNTEKLTFDIVVVRAAFVYMSMKEIKGGNKRGE
jgi:hypothetical protein